MKIKRILATVLSLVSLLSISLISSCDNSKTNSGAKENETGSPSKVVTLANFEQFNPDFQLLRLQNGFGRIDVNENKEFVKEGEQSAKLRPLGRYSDKASPFFYFELDSERFGYSYSDLNYLYSASMWMYNAQDETKQVEIGLITQVTDILAVKGRTQACGLTYNLKPGWNKLTYFIEKEDVVIPGGGTKIRGLYIQFENVPSLDINDAPIYYIDNVSLTLKTKYRDIAVDDLVGTPMQGQIVKVPVATIEDGEVTYIVYHNEKIVPVTNGQFVPNEGGEYKVVYTSIVDGFKFKKTVSIYVKPSKFVEVIDFNEETELENISQNRLPGRLTFSWLDSFKGETGVLKMLYNDDCPNFIFDPINELTAYADCEFIVVKMYIEGTLHHLGLCEKNNYYESENEIVYEKWVEYRFPISTFKENFDRLFVMFYREPMAAGTIYVSDIYAV